MSKGKPTRIRRAQHDTDNPYFQMRRDTAQDDKLSWEARGVLAYLLSKPDDWIVQVKDLQQCKCGRDKVYRILDELKTARYVFRERKQVEKGRFEWGDYLVSERPFTEMPEMDTQPFPENPDTDLPYTENKELTKDRVLETTDKESVVEIAEPKTRKENPLFDAVAKYIFEIEPALVKEQGGRIGIISSWLSGKSDGPKGVKIGYISAPASPDHVKAFAGYWKATSKANLPYDLQKFVDAWRKWASQRKTVSAPKPTNIMQVETELTAAEIEARKQALAAALKSEVAS